MRLVVSSSDGAIELKALTGRRMDRLTDLAVAIVNALPASEGPKQTIGFTAGKHIETKIAEGPCQDVAVTRHRLIRRR